MIEAQKTAFMNVVMKALKWQKSDMDNAINTCIVENHNLIDDGQALLLIADKYSIGLSKAFTTLLEEAKELIASAEAIQPVDTQAKAKANKFIDPNSIAEEIEWNEFWVKKTNRDSLKREFIPWTDVDKVTSTLSFKLIDDNLAAHMKMILGKFGNSECLECKTVDDKGALINVHAWYLRSSLLDLFEMEGKIPNKVIKVTRVSTIGDNHNIQFECEAKYS